MTEPAFERELTNLRQALVIRRNMLGLSQRELADRIGIPQSALSELETGKTASPSLLTYVRWCAALSAEVSIVVQFAPVLTKTYRTSLHLSGDLDDPDVTNDLHGPLSHS